MKTTGLRTAPRFQVGGTVRGGNLYLRRPADDELPAALQEGELCYVLAPRQMGKSSLKVRAHRELREQGVRCVLHDLQGMGTRFESSDDPSEDGSAQWFYCLLEEVTDQLRPEADLETFWTDHRRLPPVVRWSRFLRRVLLERLAAPIVIFIDEIDLILELPFRDEFFGAIRATYDQRASDPAFERLTFCLLGVAAPSELIENPERTPFNVGRGIQLADFTREQAGGFADPLAELDPEPGALLDEVWDWTRGHPYLTQKVCRHVQRQLERLGVDRRAPRDLVRAVIDELFLRPGVRLDSNLDTARARLLDAGEATPGMLSLYRRVLSGADVPADDRNPEQQRLQLTGMVAARVAGDSVRLEVRNRIFAEVFDVAWVAEQQRRRRFSDSVGRWLASGRHDDYLLRGRALKQFHDWVEECRNPTPDENDFLRRGTELQERQRELVLRRIRRLAIALAAGMVVALVAAIEFWNLKLRADVQSLLALTTAAKAQSLQWEAEEAKDEAEEAKERAVKAGQQAEEQRAEAEAAKAEAEAERDKAETEESKAQAARHRAEAAEVEAEAAREEETRQRQIAEDAEREAQRLRRLELARSVAIRSTQLRKEDQRELSALLARQAYNFHVANRGEPDDSDVFNALLVASRRLDPDRMDSSRDHSDAVRAVVSGPRGERVYSAGDDGTVRCFDRETGESELFEDGRIRPGLLGRRIAALALSDSKLAAGSYDGSILVWDVGSPGSEPEILAEPKEGSRAGVVSLAFQPGSRWLVSVDLSGRVLGWDLDPIGGEPDSNDTWRLPIVLEPGVEPTAVSFSNDGRILALGTTAGALLFDAERPLSGPSGLGGPEACCAGVSVRALAFGPRRMAVGYSGGDVVIRQSADGAAGLARASGEPLPYPHGSEVTSLSLAGDRLASASRDGTVKIWDLRRAKAAPIELEDHQGWALAVALSPGGEWVFSGGLDRTVRFRRTRAESLAEEVCGLIGRNLTTLEWAEHFEGENYDETCKNIPRQES